MSKLELRRKLPVVEKEIPGQPGKTYQTRETPKEGGSAPFLGGASQGDKRYQKTGAEKSKKRTMEWRVSGSAEDARLGKKPDKNNCTVFTLEYDSQKAQAEYARYKRESLLGTGRYTEQGIPERYADELARQDYYKSKRKEYLGKGIPEAYIGYLIDQDYERDKKEYDEGVRKRYIQMAKASRSKAEEKPTYNSGKDAPASGNEDGLLWTERSDQLEKAREKMTNGEYEEIYDQIRQEDQELSRKYGSRHTSIGSTYLTGGNTPSGDNGSYNQADQQYIKDRQEQDKLFREKAWIDYVEKYTGKDYTDNFWGQSHANYDMGRMTQDSSMAWSNYLDSPTEENRRKAETIDQLIHEVQTNNQDVYADDGTLPWFSKTLANYIPQLLDQIKTSGPLALAGGAIGFGVAGPVGAKWGAKLGRVAGSGTYSYQTMRGAAFKSLLEAGYDEETARKAANDEAVISSMIEMADTAVDLVTLGGGKLIDTVTAGSVDAMKDQIAKAVGKNMFTWLATAVGKYGINIGSEWMEEATQESVSIANENNAGSGKWALAKEAGGIFFDALFNPEDENRERIFEAGEEGAKIATMVGGGEAIANTTINHAMGKRYGSPASGNSWRAAGDAAKSGMSVMDSLTEAGLQGSELVAKLAPGAYAESIREAVKNGAKPDQALKYATADVAMEIAAERVPVDELLGSAAGDPKKAASIMDATLKQAGIEMTGEELDWLGGVAAEASKMQQHPGFVKVIALERLKGQSIEQAHTAASKVVWQKALDWAVDSGAFEGTSSLDENVVDGRETLDNNALTNSGEADVPLNDEQGIPEAYGQQEVIDQTARFGSDSLGEVGDGAVSEESQVHNQELEQEFQEVNAATESDKGIDKEEEHDTMDSRGMAMSLRKPRFHILTEEEIQSVLTEASALGINEKLLRINQGSKTGFVDDDVCINIRGDVLPDLDGKSARDRMSIRAVLAHEYYGHYMNHPSEYPIGDWRDEFRASYDAAVKAPNLTAEERRDLMIDAYDRAKEAGEFHGYDEMARRIIYGY